MPDEVQVLSLNAARTRRLPPRSAMRTPLPEGAHAARREAAEMRRCSRIAATETRHNARAASPRAPPEGLLRRQRKCFRRKEGTLFVPWTGIVQHVDAHEAGMAGYHAAQQAGRAACATAGA